VLLPLRRSDVAAFLPTGVDAAAFLRAVSGAHAVPLGSHIPVDGGGQDSNVERMRLFVEQVQAKGWIELIDGWTRGS